MWGVYSDTWFTKSHRPTFVFLFDRTECRLLAFALIVLPRLPVVGYMGLPVKCNRDERITVVRIVVVDVARRIDVKLIVVVA